MHPLQLPHTIKNKCERKCGRLRDKRCKLSKKTRNVTWFGLNTKSFPTSTATRHKGNPKSLSHFRSPSCACHQGSRQAKARRHQVTKTRLTTISLGQHDSFFPFFGASSPRMGSPVHAPKCCVAPHQVGGSSGDYRVACRSKARYTNVDLSRTNVYKALT